MTIGKSAIAKGDYVTGLVTAVTPTYASIKIGAYRAMLTPADFSWTQHKLPAELLKAGDLVVVSIKEISGTAVEVQLEQEPAAQAALLSIDNPTGEIKAMVGGYDFDESKFNRATQALRQTGSSFKVYVYATAMEQGASPFDTVVDEPVTFRSGGQDYSPHNYDEKFEGRITFRRALADSRNIPAVRLLDHVGIQNVIDLARKAGIKSPLPPYLPLALGAADLTLMEHTSAFTMFPDDGIHIDPHYIRRVTSYDGAVLEEARPDDHGRDAARSGAHDGRDAGGCGAVRHRRAREGVGPAVGREDRHDERFHRCVVHRLYAAADHRRLGRERRQARIARQKRDRRTRGASDMARVHARGGAGNARPGFPERGAARETGCGQSAAGGHARYGSAS